jgi:hypothetical protein
LSNQHKEARQRNGYKSIHFEKMNLQFGNQSKCGLTDEARRLSIAQHQSLKGTNSIAEGNALG